MNENNERQLEDLRKSIDKYYLKANLAFIFMALGLIIIILGILYIIQNGKDFGGTGPIWLIGIGLAIIVYNVFMRKINLKRANELNEDYKKSMEKMENNSMFN